jgi:hypothetical protein
MKLNQEQILTALEVAPNLISYQTLKNLIEENPALLGQVSKLIANSDYCYADEEDEDEDYCQKALLVVSNKTPSLIGSSKSILRELYDILCWKESFEYESKEITVEDIEKLELVIDLDGAPKGDALELLNYANQLKALSHEDYCIQTLKTNVADLTKDDIKQLLQSHRENFSKFISAISQFITHYSLRDYRSIDNAVEFLCLDNQKAIENSALVLDEIFENMTLLQFEDNDKTPEEKAIVDNLPTLDSLYVAKQVIALDLIPESAQGKVGRELLEVLSSVNIPEYFIDNILDAKVFGNLDAFANCIFGNETMKAQLFSMFDKKDVANKFDIVDVSGNGFSLPHRVLFKFIQYKGHLDLIKDEIIELIEKGYLNDTLEASELVESDPLFLIYGDWLLNMLATDANYTLGLLVNNSVNFDKISSNIHKLFNHLIQTKSTDEIWSWYSPAIASRFVFSSRYCSESIMAKAKSDILNHLPTDISQLDEWNIEKLAQILTDGKSKKAIEHYLSDLLKDNKNTKNVILVLKFLPVKLQKKILK